jgi:hypothetical protein
VIPSSFHASKISNSYRRILKSGFRLDSSRVDSAHPIPFSLSTLSVVCLEAPAAGEAMPPRKKRKSVPPVKKPKSAPPVVIVPDHISALPDHMLHHVLSFLPVQAAVRTCVLARRWSHLWRSTTGLRIVGLDKEKHAQVHHLRKFMYHLLLLRERTDLDTVEIKLGGFMADDQPYVNVWSRFAVMCKVRALTLHVHAHDDYLCLDGLPFASRHLRTLDLDGVLLQETFLDFAGCPALEGLKINRCTIRVDRISSCSVRHLSITGCNFGSGRRVHVSAPGLVSLTLKVDRFECKTPCFEKMALLETAHVYHGHKCVDACLNHESSGGVLCGDNNLKACKNCVPSKDDGSGNTLILGGISSAKHLELISEHGKVWRSSLIWLYIIILHS